MTRLGSHENSVRTLCREYQAINVTGRVSSCTESEESLRYGLTDLGWNIACPRPVGLRLPPLNYSPFQIRNEEEPKHQSEVTTGSHERITRGNVEQVGSLQKRTIKHVGDLPAPLSRSFVGTVLNSHTVAKRQQNSKMRTDCENHKARFSARVFSIAAVLTNQHCENSRPDASVTRWLNSFCRDSSSIRQVQADKYVYTSDGSNPLQQAQGVATDVQLAEEGFSIDSALSNAPEPTLPQVDFEGYGLGL